MNTNALLPLSSAAISAALVLSGCGEVSRTIDCNRVCSKYAECFDSDYDVAGCVDRCEDDSEADADFENRVDACGTCADRQACSESFDCVDECVGIVP